MICKQCNGSGKTYNPGYGEENCCRCHGTGKVEQTEKEYIQTCNTEQLVEFLFHIADMCSYCGDEAHSSQEKIQQCHFGKCGCQRKDWELWLKQPHTNKE